MPQLFAELSRRNVLRVVVAYVALAWLLLQVIDTITGLISLPTWVGPYALVAVAIGFPIAAFLAWAYELTPDGIQTTDETDVDQPIKRFGGRKIDFVIIGALSLVVVLLLIKDSVVPPVAPDDGRPPVVSNYTQITRSTFVVPPTPSPYPIIADSSRLYFSDFGLGQLGILQVSEAGGEAERFPITAPSPDAPFQPLSLSPDGSALIMMHLDFSRGLPFELWSYPLVGGTPRMLGSASDAVYSPDGALVAYEGDFGNLFVANADFSEPRELLQVPKRVHWIRFSPDGKRLRFTLVEFTQQQSIWEVAVDGGEARPILPVWADVDHCCGVWTPDGKYFVFQAAHDFRTQFWAMSGDSDSAVEPVQITKSALEFRRPTISVDGKTIYAVSWQLRGEVVRYDTQVDTFVPLPGFESVSGEHFNYSGDGELVAYTSYPKADLWRSNSDGSDRRQLTFPPMRVGYGVWSPDNRYIAFIGQMPHEPRQIYLVSADGGLPRRLTDDERIALAPSWYPDSRRILVYMDTKERLQVYDIEDGTFTPIPGTEGLRGPDLSPDGTRFMAFSAEGVVVQEVESGDRDVLIRRGESSADFAYWDKDGEHIFVVESSTKGIDRSVRRMNIEDKSSETVAIIGNTLSAWGVYGMWVGVDPGAAPIMLKDISIHHIYKLDWLQ